MNSTQPQTIMVWESVNGGWNKWNNTWTMYHTYNNEDSDDEDSDDEDNWRNEINEEDLEIELTNLLNKVPKILPDTPLYNNLLGEVNLWRKIIGLLPHNTI